MVLLSVTYTICNEMRNWNKVFLFFIIISVLGLFPYIFFLTYIPLPTENLLGIGWHLFTNLRVLIIWIMVPLMSYLSCYGSKCYMHLFNPNVEMLVNKIYLRNKYHFLELGAVPGRLRPFYDRLD